MAQLTLTATLVEAPNGCCEAPGFPSATTTVPFGLNGAPCPKASPVSTGAKTRNVSTPTFVSLSGVGAADDVTQADTVYVRTKSPGFQIRLTVNNPAGGVFVVGPLPLYGVFLYEPDAASGFYVTLIEVLGAGQVEYFASGAQ